MMDQQRQLLDSEKRRLAAKVRGALARMADACDYTRAVMAEANALLERINEPAPEVLSLVRPPAASTIEAFTGIVELTAVPRWDRQTRTFTVGGQIVKRFRVPSPNQEAVLNAFQEEGWPPRIDDPLPPQAGLDPKYRLHYTIHRLNQSHHAQLVRFFGDGTGEGIGWQWREAVSLARPDVRPRTRRAA